MPKRQIGHKLNSLLNMQWAKHVKGFEKKYTSGLRRMEDKKIIREEIRLLDN